MAKRSPAGIVCPRCGVPSARVHRSVRVGAGRLSAMRRLRPDVNLARIG